MAKVKCFAIPGMELWLTSNDHSPPHFHAKRTEQWEVRVFFLEGSTGKMFKVKWPRGKEVPRGDLKLLEENLQTYRIELLEEWERKVQPQ